MREWKCPSMLWTWSNVKMCEISLLYQLQDYHVADCLLCLPALLASTVKRLVRQERGIKCYCLFSSYTCCFVCLASVTTVCWVKDISGIHFSISFKLSKSNRNVLNMKSVDCELMNTIVWFINIVSPYDLLFQVFLWFSQKFPWYLDNICKFFTKSECKRPTI